VKSFIYTITSRCHRNGYTTKTCVVYRVKRGVPKHVATSREQFVSDFQLFMMTAEANKLLPRAAFKRHQFGGYEYGIAPALQNAGFAKVTQV